MWNFDAQILKIWKIHRKFRTEQTLVLFWKYLRNKSSDLYEIWHYYSWVKNYQVIFYKDSCTHAHTRGVNVCTHVLFLYFAFFQNLIPPTHSNCENYRKHLGIFGSHISKCYIIRGKMTPALHHSLPPDRRNSLILLLSH